MGAPGVPDMYGFCAHKEISEWPSVRCADGGRPAPAGFPVSGRGFHPPPDLIHEPPLIISRSLAGKNKAEPSR